MSKKVILQRKAPKDMDAWELIFFMFYDTHNKFSTKKEIAEGVNAHHKKDLPSLTMVEGTVSKAREILEGTIEYEGKCYTIRSLQDRDSYNRDLGTKHYQIVCMEQDELLWQEYKEHLLDEDLLVPKKICIISKYMYIFKLNLPTQKKKRSSSEADEKIDNTESKMIMQAKKYFSQMISPDDLYDVAHMDGNIVVILNSTPHAKNKYGERLEKFFDNV